MGSRQGPFRPCPPHQDGQVEPPRCTARLARDHSGMFRYVGDRAIVLSPLQARPRRGAAGDGSLAGVPIKKGLGGYFEAATEADQPGMGMTNRVIPAQGEERGASFT